MSSIIFIGSPEKSPKSASFKEALFVSPSDVFFRIFASFVPPIGKRFRCVHVDFLGPSLALLLLVGGLNYGYSLKNVTMSFGPNEFLIVYCLVVPVFCYVLSTLGQSDINFSEIVFLIGYSLYGHIFTLATSYLVFQEQSNAFFFLSLSVFCGLSTFRLTLVVMKTVPRPGLRLIVCSCLAIVQILSLVFMHFVYMHRTYMYRHVKAMGG